MATRTRRRASGTLVALAIVASGVVVASPARAAAATYYVAPTGNDAGAGDSVNPFQHIQRCADIAGPGDTCIIRPGTYHETVRPARSGTAGNPIAYQAETAGTVRIDGSDQISSWTHVVDGDVTSLALSDPFLLQSPFASAVHAGNVYKTKVAIDPSITEPQIFLGDQAMSEAAFPDPTPDPLEPTVQVARTGSTPMSIAGCRFATITTFRPTSSSGE